MRIYNFVRCVRDAGHAVGDLNCDGAIDFGDIDPSVLAISDPQGYVAAFGPCNLMNGGINGDDRADFDDIDPFVECLVLGECP